MTNLHFCVNCPFKKSPIHVSKSGKWKFISDCFTRLVHQRCSSHISLPRHSTFRWLISKYQTSHHSFRHRVPHLSFHLQWIIRSCFFYFLFLLFSISRFAFSPLPPHHSPLSSFFIPHPLATHSAKLLHNKHCICPWPSAVVTFLVSVCEGEHLFSSCGVMRWVRNTFR